MTPHPSNLEMSHKVAKRKAGRPPLAPSDDAQMRRERDRLAQRQSRQRKANALSEKDERIDKLSRTVESLTSLFTDFNEQVFQSRLLHSDFEAARRLKHLADRFLNVAQDASRDDAEMAYLDSPGSETQDGYFHDHSPQPVSRKHSAPLPAPRTRSPDSDGAPHLATSSPERPWSPRLTYGLMTNLQNDSVSSSRAVPSLPPCLLVPKQTFAWRLLKETFATGFPFFIDLIQNKPSMGRLHDVFQNTVAHEPMADTCRRLIKVIEYFFVLWGAPITERTKQMRRDSPEFRSLEGTALAERQHMIMLSMLIKRDVHLRGEDLADYMNAWAVERYLDSTWGLTLTGSTASLKPSFWSTASPSSDARGQSASRPSPTGLPDPPPRHFGADPGHALESNSPLPAPGHDDYVSFADYNETDAASPPVETTLPAAAAPTDLFAASSSVRAADVGDLVARIVNTSLCFGNGPRFRRQRVDEVVSQFLSEKGLVTAAPFLDFAGFSVDVTMQMQASMVAPV